jgi:hypothetical protein
LSRDPSFISVLSDSFLRLVSASIQLGMHSFGGIGWRASAGSGGIAGGGTLTLGGKELAQPATSNNSIVVIAAKRGEFRSDMACFLFGCACLALFLFAGLPSPPAARGGHTHSGHAHTQRHRPWQ